MNAPGMFGVSSKRADELINVFRHAKVDAKESIPKLAELLGIINSGEMGFRCYMFARFVAENDRHEEKKEEIKTILNMLKSLKD